MPLRFKLLSVLRRQDIVINTKKGDGHERCHLLRRVLGRAQVGLRTRAVAAKPSDLVKNEKLSLSLEQI